MGPNLAQKEATVLTGIAIMHMEVQMASRLQHDGEFLLVDVIAVLFSESLSLYGVLLVKMKICLPCFSQEQAAK